MSLASASSSRWELASDRELVEGLTVGENAALDAVWARYQGEVHAQIRRLVGPGAPVEEITQDVFIGFWSTAGRFDPARGTLGAYLHVMARGRALDWVRSEAARRRRDTNYRRALVDERGDSLEIRVAVDSLPLPELRAIWLAYYVGYSYRQVASILEIPEGTAKSHIGSALRRLHALLSIDGIEPPADVADLVPFPRSAA